MRRLYTATYKKISKVEFQIPDHVSPEAKDLIRKVLYPYAVFQVLILFQLLQHDAEKRMPLLEVAVHPWILKYKKDGRGSSH